MRTFVTAQNLHNEIVNLEETITYVERAFPPDVKENTLKHLYDCLAAKRKQFSDL